MKKYYIFFFSIFITQISVIAQDESPGKSIISGGYKLFGAGASGGSAHSLFLDYHYLMFKGQLDLSVQPYWGLSRKSYGASLGASFIAGANRKVNFIIGPQLQVWNQDDEYTNFYARSSDEDPIIRETHQTTKLAVLVNTGLRVNFKNNFLFSTNVNTGGVRLDTYERRYPNPPLTKEKSMGEKIFLGVTAGVGYRF